MGYAESSFCEDMAHNGFVKDGLRQLL